MAVVQCTFNSNKLSVSNFGVATAQDVGSNNPKDIFDAARLDLLKNIQSITSSSSQIVDTERISTRNDQKQLSFANAGKRSSWVVVLNPYHKIKYIDGLCKKQHENFDEVAKRVCGKSISELTGADANAITSKLK